MLLITTCGEIDIELWSKEAPKACRNFIQLCLEGYYDGTIFHRIVKGKAHLQIIFMVKLYKTATYIAESLSRQDNANPVFWLATGAGKMGPSSLLVISRVGPARNSPFWPCKKSLINQACSVKMATYFSYAFLWFYWPRLETLQRTWLIYML